MVTEGAQAITSGTAQVATAVASGSPIGVSASLSGKIFSNIKYLNISYSEELLEAFETWDPNFITIGLEPDMPNSIKERIVDQPVPYTFAKYNVESSFLINFWQIFSVLVIVAFFFCCFKFFENITRKAKKRFLPFSYFKAVRVSGQNFLLTQLYSVFGDLVFYSVLEWRTLDPRTYLSWLSLSISLFLYCIMFSCFYFHWKLLFTYQRLKSKSLSSEKQEELTKFIDTHEGNQVLFRDFRDNSTKVQGFLFFFTLRDVALSLIFTALYNFPLIQAWLIFLFNLLMIVYLVMSKPFTSRLDLFQQIVFETLILVVNSSVLIMALMDQFGYEAVNMRIRLGKGIIVICMIFSFTVLGFVALKLLISLSYGYKAWKAQRIKKRQQKAKLKSLSPSISFDNSIAPLENPTNVSRISIDDSLNSSPNMKINGRKFARNQWFSPEINSASKNNVYLNTQGPLLENSISQMPDDDKIKKIPVSSVRIHPHPISSSPGHIRPFNIENLNKKSIRIRPNQSQLLVEETEIFTPHSVSTTHYEHHDQRTISQENNKKAYFPRKRGDGRRNPEMICKVDIRRINNYDEISL